MKKNLVKIICTLLVLATMILPASALAQQKSPVVITKQFKGVFNPQINHTIITPLSVTDFDPLDENIIVTVKINEIRALKTIDLFSDPDFYVRVKINDEEFISDVWQNIKYVEKPNWTASAEVPKDCEFVRVSIELWDKNSNINSLCDISPDGGNGNYTQQRTAELTYSIATGVWWGDDYLGDPSGYGRLNGCDDNSINEQDRDCELWFEISQNDFDGDGLTYWLETNLYNTSPLVDNRGEDADHDGVPIEWEHTFGLTYFEWGNDSGYYMVCDPFAWENHSAFDDDNDGLNNVEEYKTWQWGSDPFRQDIFVEFDQMALGPNGEGAFIPNESFDMIREAYTKHNIVWHGDDGRLGGGEIIHFDGNMSNQGIVSQWYWKYFMHQDAHNWRRGVFRWCVMGYNSIWTWGMWFNSTLANGFTFESQLNGTIALDCFFISSKYHEMRSKIFPIIDGLYRRTFNPEKNRANVYAGVIMHETGHTLHIQAPGCDAPNCIWPWQMNYWRYGSYKSVMNYRYIYNGVNDYSDGLNGKNDYDDWGAIDLTFFNPSAY